MAFQIADLFATIRVDDAKIMKSLVGVRAKLEHVGKSMQRVSYIARRMFLAVAGVIALTVKQASDAEEAHNKFMTVFRAEGAAVSKWAQDYGKAVGRAQVDMERYLGTIQDTLVPMGIAREKATVLSKSIVKLGLDLASFNNEADSNALDNLQSALVGQSRAVLKYGVVVNQAQIQQELLNMGIQRSYDLTTNQEKVQARLNIIFRSTTDAQGDLIRTQGSFENQSKALVSSFKDMNAQIGQAFIPNAIRMMASIRGMLPGIGDWVTKNKELTVTIATITLGILGFLAVAPLLLATLGLMAAHPVVAGLLVLSTLLSVLYVKFKLAQAAQRDFLGGGLGAASESIADTQRRLDVLKLQKKGIDADIASGAGRGFGISSPESRQLIKDSANYAIKIAEVELRLEALVKAEQEVTKAVEKSNKVTNEAIELAEKKAKLAADEAKWESEWQANADKWAAAEIAIERSRMTAHQRAIADIEDEVIAMGEAAKSIGAFAEQKYNIQKYYDERLAAEEKKRRDEKIAGHQAWIARQQADMQTLESEAMALAQKRMEEKGGGAKRTGFVGVAQLGRQIQESILQKAANKERDRLLKEMAATAAKDLQVQKDIFALLPKLQFGLGWAN